MLTTLMLSTALAHIGMEEPTPRYPSDGSTNNKACPCGVGDSNRMCDDPTDRSDPDRSANVTTYQAGDTVQMRFYETIGHAGRYRIAFDPDGADMEDFNAHILLDVEDPAGSTGNTGNGDEWIFEFTLPDTPCDSCTLQLVQMMDGNTADPVDDPSGRSSYYQCADIVLLARSGTPPTGTTGPTDPDTTTTPLTSTGSTTATANLDDTASHDDDKGCACTTANPAAGSLFALVGLLAPLRRRGR